MLRLLDRAKLQIRSGVSRGGRPSLWDPCEVLRAAVASVSSPQGEEAPPAGHPGDDYGVTSFPKPRHRSQCAHRDKKIRVRVESEKRVENAKDRVRKRKAESGDASQKTRQ